MNKYTYNQLNVKKSESIPYTLVPIKPLKELSEADHVQNQSINTLFHENLEVLLNEIKQMKQLSFKDQIEYKKKIVEFVLDYYRN